MGAVCIPAQVVCPAVGGHQWQTSRKLRADVGVALPAHLGVCLSGVPTPISVCTCTTGAGSVGVAA